MADITRTDAEREANRLATRPTAADWAAEANRLAALPSRTLAQEDRMRSARVRAYVLSRTPDRRA